MKSIIRLLAVVITTGVFQLHAQNEATSTNANATTNSVLSPKEEAFKAALIKAITTNDVGALTAITCTDGVTGEWQKMLEGSNASLLQNLSKTTDPKVIFSVFSGPSPTPINYKGTKLVPNLQISEICKVEGFQLRLGDKEGKLMIICLVPEK
jgi:hypothetical protein